MKKLVLLAILFSLFASTYTCAQIKETQKEKFQSTYTSSKAIVETQHYNFVGELVYNNKKREKLSNDSNTIAIKKSEISGKVISLQSENKSFDVNGTVENYKASFDDDKQHIRIQFTVKTTTQTLEIFIDIKPNGNAFLTVSSGNYNTISWTGKIES
jgi:hypothetical protein